MSLRPLLLLLLCGHAFADVTKVGTPSSDLQGSGTNWTSLNVSHTVDAGTDLLIVEIALLAGDSGELTGVVWDTATANESLTLVDETTSSGLGGDMNTATYVLVSPTAKTANITFTNPSTSTFSTITAVNYSGNVTTSVLDATNVIGEHVENGSGTAMTIASGGTSGNLLYAAGAFRGSTADPVGLSAGWVEVIEVTTPGAGEATLQVAENEAPSGITMTASASVAFAGHMIEIVAAATVPAFDVNPTLNDATDSTITIDYDADATADNIQCMATDTAASAPSAAQIEAQTGSHGYATEATTGSADSITVTLTDNPEGPKYNVHCALEQGTSNYGTVVTVSDILIDAPTNFQFAAITSIGLNSPCEGFNDAVDPDIANGDYLLAADSVSPGGGVDETVAIAADCQFSYDADNTGPQSVLDIAVYDASVGDYHASDIDAWFNNNAPVCTEVEEVLPYNQDEAITPFDLDDDCTDADAEQLTYTTTSGTLPTGLALTGATGVISGTPTVEDELGESMLFTGTDAAGETDVVAKLIYVVETVTMPLLTTLTEDGAIIAVRDAFPWRTSGNLGLTASFVCHETEAANEVISQDPAATTEVEHDQAITIDVSTGPCGEGRRKPRIGPRIDISHLIDVPVEPDPLQLAA